MRPIKEIDDAFDEAYDDMVEQDAFDLDDGVVVFDLIRADIPALGISVRPGEYCAWDGDAGDYMPDFSITLVHEIGASPEEYLYFEQDGPYLTLHNYLGGVPECEFELVKEQ